MNLAGRQIGNYVAKSELGSGGMGVVYLCEHPLIRRRVAAKVLHPDLAASEEIVRRLFDEARAANEIASEHIIEVLDFGRMVEGGTELVYLIMELLEGEGLGHRLWRTGLTIDESLHIVRQCTDALQASHEAGIVHRDLKPENIFLLERRGDPNFVKILDFGIAKVTGNTSNKTRTGVLLGTPQYMSPEQCRGSGAVDARADVYSLGIVLYELTTGDVPFNDEGYGQVLMAQLSQQPRPPSQINKDLPKAVEEVILRAMQKNADARYQSMAEFGRAITDVLDVMNASRPVAQIPRKGLHQRATFLSTGRNRVVDGAMTPVDASVPRSMAQIDVDGATQVMAVVDPTLLPEPSTILDRDVPDAVKALNARPTFLKSEEPPRGPATEPAQASPLVTVRAQARSTPATSPALDEAGRLNTGPRGVMRPASSVPTEVRPVVTDDEIPQKKAGRTIAIVVLIVALAAAAFLFR